MMYARHRWNHFKGWRKISILPVITGYCLFPVDHQKSLTHQINPYLDKNGDNSLLIFKGGDHMASTRKVFYIKAATGYFFNKQKITEYYSNPRNYIFTRKAKTEFYQLYKSLW